MSTDPAAAASVRHDTPVNMVVSQGPQPITIPDLKGVTEDQAKAQLAAYAMVVTVETGRTVDVDKGEVFKTDPTAGSESTRTAKITLYVSEGKPLVLVPNFIQMKVDDAIAQAKGLGLVPDVQPAHIWSSRNIISDQDMTPGTYVEVGSTVQLRYN
jgi:serine/threonine-protein kinase